MRTVYAGVDNGNKATKSSREIAYESGVSEFNSEPTNMQNTIIFTNKYFSYGESRMSVLKDKTVNSDTFVLTIPAIIDAAHKDGIVEGEEFSVSLGVGLPLSVFGTDKNKFKDYFLNRGRTEVVYNGKKYVFTISECSVYPQGYAAILMAYSSVSTYRTINFVDIGGYTTDIGRLHFGKLENTSCASINSGVINLFNQIKDEVGKIGYNLSETDVEGILTDGFGIPEVDILARRIADKYVNTMLGEIKERGFELKLDTIFIGGGSELLSSVLRNNKDVNAMSIMDRFANAKAYETLIRKEAGRRSA